MGEFAGKVVLITGAGRGIGRGLAYAFAAQGAGVAANDLTPVNLDATTAHIRSLGGNARDYVFDVAKKMPVQALVEQVRADWDRIDILINNAGVEPHAPLLELDEWDWQRTLDVNLSGPFYLMHWSLNFDVKYIWINTDVEVKATGAKAGEVDINPWVFGIGARYRF